MSDKTMRTTIPDDDHHVEEPAGPWEMTWLWFALLGFVLAMAATIYFVFLR